MKLKCKIHNKEYDKNLVQGCTFSEEYNETLDSSTIILSQIEKIKNLKPYDDVYIYDGEFKGFDDQGRIIGNCSFYKHFLVDQYTEERLNLNSNLYKYKIQLFSETKGLETIQLPNISITQPLNIEKKISIYEYMEKFLELYSPKIKVVNNRNEKTWIFKNKYKLSSDYCDILDYFNKEENYKKMEEVFNDGYTPDFTLNSPNLRDVLSKLMIVKDMIPVVYNNVIYAMDITKIRGNFDFNQGKINFVVSSRNSSEYCDNLKRTYSNALSEDNTCKTVEYLGFRNKNAALMKLADLQLETRFPIYKINSVYMCYYKSADILTSNGSNTGRKKAFLCKQDITKLVKLNSERNLLSKDWDDFKNLKKPQSVDDMGKYNFSTIGYDIGSNIISGFGETYSYPEKILLIPITSTRIETIFRLLDKFHPYGIYGPGYLNRTLSPEDVEAGNYVAIKNEDVGKLSNIIAPFIPTFVDDLNETIRSDLAETLKLKSFFFIVDYDAFYNGTIIHTKDEATGEITVNDNSSSSLTLLEQDGIAQKEKINRLGNKNYIIPALYKDFSEIQSLGSCYDNEDEKNIIIYHKEYSINENVINCTYKAIKDHVLKNYFTSVYAKHRPYNLMSYGESITRSENKKKFLYLSKNKIFYEAEENQISFFNFDDKKYVEKILSFVKETNIFNDKFIYDDKIDYAYIEINSPIYNNDGKIIEYEKTKYASDLNEFVSGNSMCFNMKMADNVSMGVAIKKAMPFEYGDDLLDVSGKLIINPKEDYTGSSQEWLMTTDDIETGFAEKIGFYVGHYNEATEAMTNVNFVEDFTDIDDIRNKVSSIYEDFLFKLPKLSSYLTGDKISLTNSLGGEYTINKDNKEIIDMTLQLEPITDYENNEIVLSPWVMKLSNLMSNYDKFFEDKDIIDVNKTEGIIRIYANTLDKDNGKEGNWALPDPHSSIMMTIAIPSNYTKEQLEEIDILKTNSPIVFSDYFENINSKLPETNNIKYYSFTPKKVKDIIFDNDGKVYEMQIEGEQEVEAYVYDNTISIGWPPVPMPIYKWKKVKENVVLYFRDFYKRSKETIENLDVFDENYIYLSNCYLKETSLLGAKNIIAVYNYRDGRKPQVDYSSKEYDDGMVHFSYGNSSYFYEVTMQADYTSGLTSYLSNTRFYWPTMTNNANINKIDDQKAADYPIFLSKKDGSEVDNVTTTKYLKNMFVVLKDEKVNKKDIYDEFRCKQEEEPIAYNTLKREKFLTSITDLKVNTVFDLSYADQVPVLKIDLSNNLIKEKWESLPENKKEMSVQLWFLDNIKTQIGSSKPDITGAAYKFVFGVNVAQEDIDREYINIYVSMLSNLSTTVYDEYHDIVGNIYNFKNSFYSKKYYEPTITYNSSDSKIVVEFNKDLKNKAQEHGIISQKIQFDVGYRNNSGIIQHQKVDYYLELIDDTLFLNTDETIFWVPKNIELRENEDKLYCAFTSLEYFIVKTFDVEFNNINYYGTDKQYYE